MAVAAVVLLGTASATSYAANGSANPVNVVVSNTADKPVPVAGSVSVSNLPGTQSVEVSNFPSSQPVTGTVDVGNLPETQNVRGTVGITGPVTTTPATVPESFHHYIDTSTGTRWYVVPEGKQLRLRTLSADMHANKDWTANASVSVCPHRGDIHAYCDPATPDIHIPLHSKAGLGGSTYDFWAGTVLVDVVVPAGHRVQASGQQSRPDGLVAGDPGVQISIFGELEPAAGS